MIIHDDFEQGSQQWHAIRCGLPTASAFSRIVMNTKDADGNYKLSTGLQGYAASLAAELFAGKPLDQFDGTSWMDRGKEKEAEARELYAFTHDVDVRQVGFITADDGLCGCSPDALLGDGGGLEIKMQKAENHLLTVQYYEKHGRAEPKYTQQVQGGLWITGLSYWSQLFYHPDLPPLVIRQTPDAAMHKALSIGVKRVLAERDANLATLRNPSMMAGDVGLAVKGE